MMLHLATFESIPHTSIDTQFNLGIYSDGVRRPASQSSKVLTGIPVCSENSFLLRPLFPYPVSIEAALHPQTSAYYNSHAR